MIKILADSTLPHLNDFQSPFHLSYYQDEASLYSQIADHSVLLCRSTLKVTSELLKGSAIECVATASSGIDHIDTCYLKKQHITLLDAKGCNAHAVADYVSSCIAWLIKNNILEKNKRIRAGIVGFGKVGQQVLQRLMAFGFEWVIYDPLKALHEADFKSCPLEALYECDLICLHANLHDEPPFPSRSLINHSFLQHLKSNTVILNASRGGIVSEEEVLNQPQDLIYCTDVYLQEPNINPQIVERATLCTPHIAGHSIEAKANAVIHLAQALYQHYQIAPPQINALSPVYMSPYPQESYEDYRLRLYNPIDETQQLKQAKDKQAAFLKLRKAHQFRHDWSEHE